MLKLFAGSLMVCWMMVAQITETRAEIDFFPGLRKLPPVRHVNADMQEENNNLIARFYRMFIAEEARRRLQRLQPSQFNRKQQQQQIAYDSPPFDLQEVAVPGFTYQFPIGKIDFDPAEGDIDQTIPFAVRPNDPRFYETTETDTSDQQQQVAYNRDYQTMLGERASSDYGLSAGSTGDRSVNIKAPMGVHPKVSAMGGNGGRRGDPSESSIINNGQYLQRSDVIKKHLDLNSVDMYVVAVIAGVSATLTVGLIAIGIAWYTLHKKGLAAADVDYPAYGVTGPNKETSPSGDRRLAQSAQMYHYQHQKQQIIAMEHRASNEQRNGSMTDVESDEENEEGDYTVYECPGLAPTGEMEVKNPLFLDDPTPATPATGLNPDKVNQSKKPVDTNNQTKK